MKESAPHYLLMADASRRTGLGRWRFVLQPSDGSAPLEAGDVEPDIWGERLDLLTVLRGLESLNQPSRVTVVGCTRYVEEGILYGLAEWRDNQWRWEYFGQMVPVRDADLWQRMDRVLQFHQVDCTQRRFDAGHGSPSGHHWNRTPQRKKWINSVAGGEWLKYCAPLLAAWCGLCVEMASWFWQTVLGFRAQGLWPRIRSLGFRIQGSTFFGRT
jgi:ribonuclease HI